ncbi:MULTISPECIES: AraC family transcriptional regulator [Catenuloplanes]|uniref:AraC-like DNA-binding protein n=1 Tax=Catenuloplanes niger TaxID=587534 RepID=A0AAE3ZLK1_9ACTN|nr:AraC family transcriptional regulator [Catenuloplanes niger]MDR7320889.1 AraC-like DNA-binding protein [Catenuloplanes niger]
MHLSLRTDDLDQARGAVVDGYYGSRLDVLGQAAPVGAVFDLLVNNTMTIGLMRFAVDVRTRTPELGSYHVNLPLDGNLSWQQPHAGPRIATPKEAAVYRPEGYTLVDRWPAGTRLLAVKVDRETMERTLGRMIGRPVEESILLAPVMNVVDGPGRTWTGLVRLLAAQSRGPDGLAAHPLLGPQIAEAAVRALLLSVDHQFAELLHDPFSRPATSASIQRALDAIHDAPELPWTLSELARRARVSTRTLQIGFRRHCGATPTAYLRDVRLTRAHLELRVSDPAATKVTEIASRWGFVHMGRFAASYRARYGCQPSDTLHDVSP